MSNRGSTSKKRGYKLLKHGLEMTAIVKFIYDCITTLSSTSFRFRVIFKNRFCERQYSILHILASEGRRDFNMGLK